MLKARSLLTAPRMPAPRAEHSFNPFDAVSDVVIDCGVPGCGWHAMGPRTDCKRAWDAHNALYHSEETGVILINSPRQ